MLSESRNLPSVMAFAAIIYMTPSVLGALEALEKSRKAFHKRPIPMRT